LRRAEQQRQDEDHRRNSSRKTSRHRPPSYHDGASARSDYGVVFFCSVFVGAGETAGFAEAAAFGLAAGAALPPSLCCLRGSSAAIAFPSLTSTASTTAIESATSSSCP